MGTMLEGGWEEVMGLVTACFKALAADCSHIGMNLKLDRGDGLGARVFSQSDDWAQSNPTCGGRFVSDKGWSIMAADDVDLARNKVTLVTRENLMRALEEVQRPPDPDELLARADAAPVETQRNSQAG